MKINCLFDKLVSIGDLKSHPKNRNIHPKDQIVRLAQILEYQGWRYPVKVSKLSGFVTSGHGRIEAARKNKWKEIPVNYQEYDSEAQEYADVQADNAIASWAELDLSGINEDALAFGPEFDLDLLGIKDFKLVDPTKEPPGCDEDEVPEHVEPTAKLGDIWLLGNHRLMCEDSTSIDAVEKLMNGENADMVFTDPPYGVMERTMRKTAGRGKLAENHDLPPVIGDDSTSTAIDAFNLCVGLGINGIWWGANYYAHSVPEVGSWLIWDKRGDVPSDDNADCEMAWTWNKKPARVFKHLWRGCIRESERKESKVHPTQKPVALAEWSFESYGNPKSVLDLFGGSGSTLIACEKTGRKCFMMELDPHYCDVIVSRWEKYAGKKAELLNGQAS